MAALVVRPLSPNTWQDFARLVEQHNGVWGGCWCLGFHAEGAEQGAHRRQAKEDRVRSGTAHAALVYDGDDCVGWCQFGSPGELPRIKRKRVYQAGEVRPPDWRITCFFVGNEYRNRGVASVALQGALQQIASLGGGLVESFPEDVTGRRTSGGFLHNATTSIFEREGFTRERQLGKHHWLMTKVVPRSRVRRSS
ncbi:GNAT family N-acetyltransferase [Jatrophihabitans sp. DSM 45814]